MIAEAPINVEHLIIYTLPPTITAGASVLVALLNGRVARRTRARVEEHSERLASIDTAVNGRESHHQTLRENVQTLVDREQALDSQPPKQPIEENHGD